MGELNKPATRRTFRWPRATREMVRTYLNTAPSELSRQDDHGAQIGLRALITRIAAVSGNPRGACWRFVRQSGVTSKRSYRHAGTPESCETLDKECRSSGRKCTPPRPVHRVRGEDESCRNLRDIWAFRQSCTDQTEHSCPGLFPLAYIANTDPAPSTFPSRKACH
jgi:hypothetical protein